MNRNGISEGHMPPELPPPPPTGTTTAKASARDASAPAPSARRGPAAAVPELAELAELAWTAPPEWRFLGQPSIGPVRAHFYAAEEGREHVDVYVVHQIATRGANSDERLRDAVARESEGFARVDHKDVTTRTAGGRTVTVVELRGVRRETTAEDRVAEVPDRVQVAALIPTDGAPIRVAMDGRPDLVQRSRDSFFAFVDGLKTGSSGSSR